MADWSAILQNSTVPGTFGTDQNPSPQPPPAYSPYGTGQGEANQEPMSDEELEAIVRIQLNDAASFVDTELSPRRAKATDYYNARPFGDEQEGRSRAISQDVRDVVLSILPSLLEVFFSSERTVEYVARIPEGADPALIASRVQAAEQATDYINYVLQEDNQGFLAFHSWFKDALIRKTGILKVWAENAVEVKTETYEDLDLWSRMAVHASLTANDRVDFEAAYPNPAKPTPANPQFPSGQQPSPADFPDRLYRMQVTRQHPSKKFRIVCLPPEEFVISRSAAAMMDESFVGHRTSLPASELVAMGYPQELVDEMGASYSMMTNQERLARAPWSTGNEPVNASPAMRLIDYAECYTRVDYDNDGIAELRKVCLMGAGWKMVAHEPADEAPFAVICPDPEPHIFFGNSVADQLMDIQRIKSQIMRLMLDSLAQSIRPRSWVVEGQVNLDDALNSDVGAVVRMRQPGMMGDLSTPFVGQAAFPMLDYLDNVREDRTGVTRASQGLDPDALQSTTAAAVQATLQNAQQHILMIARIFAETGVARLFKILLRLVVTHQPRARIVRLRNKYVEVNPSEWDATMDVSVNTALGTGLKGEKMNVLQGIAAKQELILQTLGPSNPLVSLAQYSNCLRKMVELAGYKDSSQFFSPVPPDWQPPPQQPQSNPQQQAALIVAQAQQEQTKADVAKKAGELNLNRQKMFLDDATRRYQIESDANVRMAQIQAQFGANQAQTAAKIQTENQRIASQERIASMPEPQAPQPATPAAPPAGADQPVPGAGFGQGGQNA